MDVKFNLSDFQSALRILIPITRNGTIPSHSCVYIEIVQANDAEYFAKMIASNLHISLTIYVPVAEMNQMGSFLVSLDKLSDMLKRSKTNSVRIYWHEKNQTLQFTAGYLRGRLSIMDVTQFIPPTDGDWEDFVVGLAPLYEGLQKTSFAMASKNTGSPQLECVQFSLKGDTLQLTASDRMQIAVSRMAIQRRHDDNVPAQTIPSDNVRNLTKILDAISSMEWISARDAIVVVPDGKILKQLVIDLGMATIALTVADQHHFPSLTLDKYERDFPIRFTVQKDVILEALDICSIASRDNAGISFIEIPDAHDGMLDRTIIYFIAEATDNNEAIRIDVPVIPHTPVQRSFFGIDSKKMHGGLRAFTRESITVHREVDSSMQVLVFRPDNENHFGEGSLEPELVDHFLIMTLVHASQLSSEAGIYD